MKSHLKSRIQFKCNWAFREDTYPGLLAQQGRVANSLPSHLYRPSVANRRPFAARLAGNGHPY